MDWNNEPPFGFRNAEDLSAAFTKHCETHLGTICLSGVVSKQRILDVHNAWREDLERGERSNFREDGIRPGHVKAAAFLTYWLRREAPLINLVSLEGQYSEFTTLCIEIGGIDHDEFTELTVEELGNQKFLSGITFAELLDFRKRAFAYSNEFFSFTFGFYLAKKFEEQKQLEAGRQVEIALPSSAFVDDICYLFKFKNVSPHSIDLIYRALLMNHSGPV